jgi:hypothetical protein
MSVMQSLRVRRSRAFAVRFRETLERQEFPVREFDIQGLMKPKWVLDASGGLVTTEIGFVTMTLLTSLVQFRDELTLVPGCDDAGNQGYLVFRANRLPFHSLAASPRDACAEVLAAHRRADALVARFGDRDALKSAVRAAPWHRMCSIDDTYTAGLCEWGVKSFLNRYKLRRVGFAVGMPHGVLRLAGSYGERITAAALVRSQRNDSFARAEQ